MKELHHGTRVKRLNDFLEEDQKRKKKKKKKSKKGKDGQDEIDIDDSITPQFQYEHEMEVTVAQLGQEEQNFMPERRWGSMKVFAGVQLQAGFRVEIKRRTEGATRGTTDKYYYTPSGKKCR